MCRDGDGRLLLTRFVSPEHPDSGKWTMPGGGMEWGESPVETAIRELGEETGMDAVIGPVMGVFSRWYTEEDSARGEAGHILGIVYEARGLTGQLREDFADETTTDAAAWFSVEDIEELPRVELVDFVLTLI